MADKMTQFKGEVFKKTNQIIGSDLHYSADILFKTSMHVRASYKGYYRDIRQYKAIWSN